MLLGLTTVPLFFAHLTCTQTVPPPPRPLSSFDTLALDLDDLTVKQRTVNSLGAVCLKALFFVDFRPFFLKIQ